MTLPAESHKPFQYLIYFFGVGELSPLSFFNSFFLSPLLHPLFHGANVEHSFSQCQSGLQLASPRAFLHSQLLSASALRYTSMHHTFPASYLYEQAKANGRVNDVLLISIKLCIVSGMSVNLYSWVPWLGALSVNFSLMSSDLSCLLSLLSFRLMFSCS